VRGALPNSLLISYVGNVALGNGGGGVQVAHGAVEGEYWTNNDNQDGWIDVPHAAANATVFDP